MADSTPALQSEDPLAPSHHQMVHHRLSRDKMVLECLVSWAVGHEEKEICPICFDEFTTTGVDDGKDTPNASSGLNNGCPEFPVITPCMHKFGSLCLERWLLTSDSCPLCRRKLISYESPDNNDAQYIQRSHSTETLNTFPPLSNPLQEIMAIHGREMRDMTSFAQPNISRSLSFDSTQSMATFEQQRWNARMGGLGFMNPFYNNPRNTPIARSDGRAIRARSPSSATTHGHPAVTSIASIAPNTTMYSMGWVRRNYPDANLTSYELRSETGNTEPYNLTREPNNSSSNQSWRNWNYVSARSHRESPRRNGSRNHHSIRNALELATGVRTAVGMPRGERTISSRRGAATPRRVEATNEYSVARVMGQVLGMATVIGMPRAEWRNSSNPPSRNSVSSNFSTATQMSSVNSGSIYTRTKNYTTNVMLRALQTPSHTHPPRSQHLHLLTNPAQYFRLRSISNEDTVGRELGLSQDLVLGSLNIHQDSSARTNLLSLLGSSICVAECYVSEAGHTSVAIVDAQILHNPLSSLTAQDRCRLHSLGLGLASGLVLDLDGSLGVRGVAEGDGDQVTSRNRHVGEAEGVGRVPLVPCTVGHLAALVDGGVNTGLPEALAGFALAPAVDTDPGGHGEDLGGGFAGGSLLGDGDGELSVHALVLVFSEVVEDTSGPVCVVGVVGLFCGAAGEGARGAAGDEGAEGEGAGELHFGGWVFFVGFWLRWLEVVSFDVGKECVNGQMNVGVDEI
ncbi:hypothetical protein EYC80_003976 [Monilinia laxa]|uniref:RING-type domain-containing protein n=1 Tax=Monilinia laxa TaxID=61186 RepID=A0A5N6KND1_MONLA|nr:hypothetical protein EYC80_003976 [Monilinia laxa]